MSTSAGTEPRRHARPDEEPTLLVGPQLPEVDRHAPELALIEQLPGLAAEMQCGRVADDELSRLSPFRSPAPRPPDSFARGLAVDQVHLPPIVGLPAARCEFVIRFRLPLLPVVLEDRSGPLCLICPVVPTFFNW
jgi:hypothetical protein